MFNWDCCPFQQLWCPWGGPGVHLLNISDFYASENNHCIQTRNIGQKWKGLFTPRETSPKNILSAVDINLRHNSYWLREYQQLKRENDQLSRGGHMVSQIPLLHSRYLCQESIQCTNITLKTIWTQQKQEGGPSNTSPRVAGDC